MDDIFFASKDGVSNRRFIYYLLEIEKKKMQVPLCHGYTR
jgi:hypothetical protein